MNNNLKLIWTGYKDLSVSSIAINDVAEVKAGDTRYQLGFIKNDKNFSLTVNFDDSTTPKGNGVGSGLKAETWENLSEYLTAVEILNTLNFY